MIEIFMENPDPELLGVLLLTSGIYIKWRNKFEVRRANACVAFRSAIVKEFDFIYTYVESWPEDTDAFVRARISNLQIAVESFRPYVPWKNRRSFDRAWFSLRCAMGKKIEVRGYYRSVGFGDNTNYKENFEHYVDRLLSYANGK